MKVIKSIIQSAKKSLKGEERLWKVFWLWGIALYTSSISIGLGIFFSRYKTTILGDIVGLLGLVLVFVYPIMFCYSLWRCAFNTRTKTWSYIARIYSILFIPAIHWWVSAPVLWGSIFLI